MKKDFLEFRSLINVLLLWFVLVAIFSVPIIAFVFFIHYLIDFLNRIIP